MLGPISAHRVLILRLSLLAAAITVLLAVLPADFSAMADAATVRTQSLGLKKSAPDVLTQSVAVQASISTAATRPASTSEVGAGTVLNRAEPKAPGQATVAAELRELKTGRIGHSAVILRSGPSKSASRLSVLAAGSPVRLAEIVKGWVHVYAANGSGWIYSTYLLGFTR
jgi:hypothetical protein